MRTITASGAIPRNDVDEIGNWLSSVGTRLHRIGSEWAARRRTAKDVPVPARGRRQGFVPADVAAFVATAMRID